MTHETEIKNLLSIVDELRKLAAMSPHLREDDRKFLARQKRMIKRYIAGKPLNPEFVPA